MTRPTSVFAASRCRTRVMIQATKLRNSTAVTIPNVTKNHRMRRGPWDEAGEKSTVRAQPTDARAGLEGDDDRHRPPGAPRGRGRVLAPNAFLLEKSSHETSSPP